jgi:hypothetical protein
MYAWSKRGKNLVSTPLHSTPPQKLDYKNNNLTMLQVMHNDNITFHKGLGAFGYNDRMGWDRTIPQIRLFGSGSRVGTSVVPNYPLKLEGRERTPEDVPVLAVP